MPTAVVEIPPRPLAQDLPRKRWTRAECALLESAGVLEDQRFELIEGELINKMGKKRPHADGAALLLAWLIQVFGGRFVNSEAPINVAPEDNPTNEPQPDIIVFKHSYRSFRSTTPQPSDLESVVEVSDTSLAFDLTIKAGLYARAGVVEYWVLDLAGRRLVVHREPANGLYGSIVAFGEQENVSALSAPGAQLRVADLFPSDEV